MATPLIKYYHFITVSKHYSSGSGIFTLWDSDGDHRFIIKRFNRRITIVKLVGVNQYLQVVGLYQHTDRSRILLPVFFLLGTSLIPVIQVKVCPDINE